MQAQVRDLGLIRKQSCDAGYGLGTFRYPKLKRESRFSSKMQKTQRKPPAEERTDEIVVFLIWGLNLYKEIVFRV